MKRALFSALLLTTASAAALPAADEPPAKTKGTPAAMPVTADDLAAVLTKLGSEDQSSAERLEHLSMDAKRVHALLLARGRSYVKLARAGLLPIGGGLDALVDHASRIERLRRALSRDIERERSIAEERVLLVKRRASLDERRSVLETEQAALERSHTAILAAEDREAAFRQAFVSGGDGVSHTAVYGGGLSQLDPTAIASGFAGQRGHLPFPLQGRVEVRRVRHPSADGPGLEMASPAGAVVRAVYPGRVAFADSYADYGRAVIVDHGSGYYTVSANLAAIDVRVGDELSASDRIGNIAPGGRLYVEIRRGATTVNPASWFGI